MKFDIRETTTEFTWIYQRNRMPGRCVVLNMTQDCLYIVISAYNEQDTIENVAREWHNVVSKVGKDSRLVINE